MTQSTMPQPAQGIYRRSDSTNWQWRIKVPQDLKHLHDGKQWAGGCSLKTSDLREANRLAADLRSEWLNRFAQQRKQLAPKQVDRITPDLAHFLAGTALHGILESNEAFRCSPSDQERLLGWMRSMGMPGADTARDLIAWTGASGTPALDPLGGMSEPLAEMLSKLNLRLDEEVGRALATGNLRKALPGMQYVAQRHGLVFDENTPGVAEGLWTYLRAIKQATEGKVKRDQGKVVETPPAPPLKQVEAKNVRRLRDVFGRWKAGKDDESDSVKKKLSALALYEEQTGDPPLQELTRDQGDAFRAWLLTDQSARSRTKRDWSSKTKHMIFDDLKTLLNYARRDLEWTVRNPWEGLNIDFETEEERDPWTPEQVRKFFGLPLFTKYELPRTTAENGGPAAYWIPLLGLFTGARVGELCQLLVADVVTPDGVPSISINKKETEKGTGKRVKTKAGVRTVPLHPELLRLGFLEYVATIREAGETRLWPALEAGTEKRKPSSYFSGWFGETVKKVLGDDAPDFHSLRHTVKTKLAGARIPKEEADRIMGWKSKGIGAGYTHYTAAMLLDAVKKVEYPELTLPRVFAPETEEEEATA